MQSPIAKADAEDQPQEGTGQARKVLAEGTAEARDEALEQPRDRGRARRLVNVSKCDAKRPVNAFDGFQRVTQRAT